VAFWQPQDTAASQARLARSLKHDPSAWLSAFQKNIYTSKGKANSSTSLTQDGVSTPLKNISQLGLLFPIHGKTKNDPNHEPNIHNLSCITLTLRHVRRQAHLGRRRVKQFTAHTHLLCFHENDHLMCIHISYIYTLYNYITTCTYCPNIIPKLRSCPPRLVAQIVSFRGSSASLRLPVTARRFVAERTSAWCCLRKSPERSTAPRQDCGE